MSDFRVFLTLLLAVAIAAGQKNGRQPRGFVAEPPSRPRSPLPSPASLSGEAISVVAFGASGDGSTDNTGPFQQAMNAAGANGSVVFVPAGLYLFRGHLTIPEGVTLEGTYRAVPSNAMGQGAGKPSKGSVLQPTADRGNAGGQPFVTMTTNSVLRGFCVHYPDVDADPAPTPYPFTIQMGGNNPAVEDVELLNSYNGINATEAARHYIARVQGQPTNIGVYVDKTYDIGRIEDVHFNPWYNPSKAFMAHQLASGQAFVFARTDWEYVFNTFAFGYAVGYRFIQSDAGSCNGNFVGIGADMAANASVLVEAADPWGILITNGEFTSFVDPHFGEELTQSTQVVVAASNHGAVRFSNSAFWGPSWQVANIDGSGTVGFSDCTFSQWDAKDKGLPAISVAGSASLVASGNEFQQKGVQIHLAATVRRAAITGNLVAGPVNIVNDGAKQVQAGFNVGDE